jgi:hypothetical protein
LCKWLAGLIDCEGSLLVSKKGYTSLEITTVAALLEDLPCLKYIKNKLSGSIKMLAQQQELKLGDIDCITKRYD